MKGLNRLFALFFAAALLGALLAGCSPKAQPEPAQTDTTQAQDGAQPQGDAQPEDSGTVSVPEQPERTSEQQTIQFTVLSGPTGVGAGWLMEQYAAGSAPKDSSFQLESTVLTENSEAVAALNSGSADVAAIATNVAANLYQKTNGKITMLAINTKGVLYILEKGTQEITSMADLRGRTIYAVGQGANPEYVLRDLLTKNGLDPDSDVTLEWMSAQEITAKMLSEEQAVCMLPVPAATALQLKDTGVREALDLSAQWDALYPTPMVMGCLAVRTQFLEENPELVSDFLAAYEASIQFMTDEANLDEAAALVEQYGITPSAAVAKAAIPRCNLTFLTGAEMTEAAQAYYELLFQANPDSIGGAMPYDDFFYTP